MILTLLRIAIINLRRDRVVQAMAFLMPVIFFSIFAGVFGSQGRDRTARVRVAVVDEDGSAASARLVTALKEENGLSTRTVAPPVGAAPKAAAVTLDRARALALVRAGDVPVAIVIPKGFGASFGSFDSSGRTVELLSDTSDPVAPQVVSGLLQKVEMTAAPDLLAKQGIGMFEKYAGGLTPEQKRVTESWFGMLDGKAPSDSAKTGTGPSAGGPAAGGAKMGGLINARIVDVLGEKKTNPIIAFYAAGIAVNGLGYGLQFRLRLHPHRIAPARQSGAAHRQTHRVGRKKHARKKLPGSRRLYSSGIPAGVETLRVST